MTTTQIAHLLNARRNGRGRWIAKCPAHDDRRPSLSIGEGRNGRVLLHCFAGCELAAVVAALGLKPRDLFPESQADPKAIAEARKAAEQRERDRKRQASKERRIATEYRMVDRAIYNMGRKLALHPEDERLARRFHMALDVQRQMEQKNGWGG